MRPETRAVHLGRGGGSSGDPVNAPVVFTSTYHAGGDTTYGRDANPTWQDLEEVVGALEGGMARAFASGLAATAAVIEMVPAGGVVVAPGGSYNGTRRLLADLASRGRLVVRLVDASDATGTLAACEGAALLWLESPSNPMMEVVDLRALVAGAHARGVLAAVDNTFATPLLQNPLVDAGADFVVHSATKQLAGHSDVLLGIVVVAPGRNDLLEAVQLRRTLHGAVPGPMEAFLTLRGIRTLAVRVERAQQSAADLADRLGAHPAVAAVRYPGRAAALPPGLRGGGTVLSFHTAGGAAAAVRLCEAVQLIVHATSLGGVESLIERRNRWAGEEATPPDLVRLSVGLEHVEDLWADLEQALGT